MRQKKGSYQNSMKKRDECSKVTMKEHKEGWMKPIKHAPIACFTRNLTKAPGK